jgi:hypothetical protein
MTAAQKLDISTWTLERVGDAMRAWRQTCDSATTAAALIDGLALAVDDVQQGDDDRRATVAAIAAELARRYGKQTKQAHAKQASCTSL